MDKTIHVCICMGSSCFSRGNGEAVERLEQFIEERGLAERAQLEGRLCMGRCAEGPLLEIDGREHTAVHPDCVTDILELSLEEPA